MFELSDRAKQLQSELNEFMADHIYPNEETHHRQIVEPVSA
mgnify:CR=1 FL=1